MDKDSSRPIPLNSAIVTKDSMLATDVAEARGRSLAIAAVMSFSKFSAGYGPKGLSAINETTSQFQLPEAMKGWMAAMT
jgi:hypothetical protein